jgi:hypothetical protein
LIKEKEAITNESKENNDKINTENDILTNKSPK